MRTSLLMLMTVGCTGDATLGAAPRVVRPDAGSARLDAGSARLDAGSALLDAGALADVSVDSADDGADKPLMVEIDVALSEDRCNTCFDLSARSDTVSGDSAVVWDDGSRERSRHVCPTALSSSYTVTLLEVPSGRTAATTRSLSARSGTCADAGTPEPMLCVDNGTFAITPARPPTPPNALPASPWLACAKMLPNQTLPNRPQIVDSSATIMGIPVLPATNGTTYLGLAEYEQASAQLCATIEKGESRFFTLDLADVSGSAGPDVGLPRLEIWGGRAADCSQSEKLWTSEALSSGWTSSCVRITPQNLTDNLTLRAVSSAPRNFPGRVLVDHLVPVAACP